MEMALLIHSIFPVVLMILPKDDLQDTDPDISEIRTFTVSRRELYRRGNTQAYIRFFFFF